jgi:hypothetical protein
MKTPNDAGLAATRHWNIDGLPDIEAGGLLILWGGVLAGHEIWPSRLTAIASGILPVLLVAVFLIVDALLVPRLKRRLTYPRAGYVRPRATPYRRGTAAGLGAFSAAAMMAWIAGGRGLDRPHMPSIVAGLGTLFLAYCGWRFRLPRLFAYAVAAAAVGLALPPTWPPDLGVGAFQVAVGTLLLAGGGLTLRRFLRIPVPETP